MEKILRILGIVASIGDSVQTGVNWKVAWRFWSRNGGPGGLTIASGNDGVCIWDGVWVQYVEWVEMCIWLWHSCNLNLL